MERRARPDESGSVGEPVVVGGAVIAENDAFAALKSYQAAVGYPDAPAAAWRELGECLRKTGDQTGAGQALAAYVAKSPDAEDRWIIESELKHLNGDATK